jgi:hypothetical protein
MAPPRRTTSERERYLLGLQPTTLVPRHTFINPSPDPGSVLYSPYIDIARQRGLTPIRPLFVPNSALHSIDTGNVLTRGMRASILCLDFGASTANWIPATVEGNRRPHVQFRGGSVTLRAIEAVFIDEVARFKRRAILTIMEHEMDHARDSGISLSREVIRGVCADPMVRDHLIDRRPIDESTWRQWFGSQQPGPWQQRLDAILAAARLDDPYSALLRPPSGDSVIARRQIDSFLFLGIWKPVSERYGEALHRDPHHLQSMNEVASALSEPDDPDLYREHYGRLPANMA